MAGRRHQLDQRLRATARPQGQRRCGPIADRRQITERAILRQARPEEVAGLRRHRQSDRRRHHRPDHVRHDHIIGARIRRDRSMEGQHRLRGSHDRHTTLAPLHRRRRPARHPHRQHRRAALNRRHRHRCGGNPRRQNIFHQEGRAGPHRRRHVPGLISRRACSQRDRHIPVSRRPRNRHRARQTGTRHRDLTQRVTRRDQRHIRRRQRHRHRVQIGIRHDKGRWPGIGFHH